MVEVLITRYMDPVLVDRIRAVDARLVVHYEPRLMRMPVGRDALFYDPERLATIGPLDHGPEWTRSGDEEHEWRTLLASTEVWFDVDLTLAEGPRQIAPRLRWIQAIAAGVEPYLAFIPGLADSGIELVAARGVHSAALADFALMAILQHAKRLDRLRDARRRAVWQEFVVGPVAGTVACIVGYGSIGQAVGRRLEAFDVEVVAVSRRDPADVTVGSWYPPERIAEAVARADWIILCLPDSSTTRGLVDGPAIQAMKPGAYIVNIGRGSTLDQDALIDGLSSGHLGGAALDVFAVEPLPGDSPLWSLDDVIVSPHATAFVGKRPMEAFVDMFCENLRHYLEGRSLVDIHRTGLSTSG